MVAARLVVGQWESGSLAGQCALVVYGGVLDGVRADRRGIEPDFSMGRNRPSASWRGRRRGHVGNVGICRGVAANMGQCGPSVWKGGGTCVASLHIKDFGGRGCSEGVWGWGWGEL